MSVRSQAFLVLVALGLGMGLPAANLLAIERIEQFHSQIEIQSDGSMEVTETIVVRAEGQSIRRGIFRDFPTRYTDQNGNRVVVDFEPIEVLRDGLPEPWFTERRDNGVRLNTGDDRLLEVPATIEYTLRYRTNRQLGFFEDHDELYWNVTGNGWRFPIDEASAQVVLPESATFDRLEASAFTGRFGSQNQHAIAEVAAVNRFRFITTRPLSPGQGLTIVAEWPKGMIDEPTDWQRFGWLLSDNRGVLVLLLGIPLIIFFYYRQWHQKGRDPTPGVIIARYAPPAGYSPADLRYMLRRGHDSRCFAADLVELGVKGYVRIHREGGRNGVFKKDPDWVVTSIRSDSMETLSASQSALLKALFADGPVVKFEKSNASLLMTARSAQAKALSTRFKGDYLINNGGVIGLGVAASIVLFVLALIIGQGFAPGLTLALSFALAVANGLFIWLLQNVTTKGRALLDQIEGLKRYLDIAEKQDLARLEHRNEDEPELNAERFEALLPYALALDVEGAWTKKFELAAGTTAAAAAASGLSWYTSAAGRPGSLAELGDTLGQGLSSQISSSSTPPGSGSGGGGGGFSGGGGGGGGGGGR